MDILKTFLHPLLIAFIQLAVAVDLIGTLPVYISMIEPVQEDKRDRILRAGLMTALGVGMLFVFLGKLVFATIGITMGDFQIAGGIILILFGVIDLVGEEKSTRKPTEAFGVVPLGVPLIVGPAVISVLLLSISQYGVLITFLSFIGNLILAAFVFHYAPKLSIFLGKNGVKAISKVMMLFLIAIGMKMIRLGIFASFYTN